MAITPGSRTPVQFPHAPEPSRRQRWWALDRPVTYRTLVQYGAPVVTGGGAWAAMPEAWATPVTVAVMAAVATWLAARPKR